MVLKTAKSGVYSGNTLRASNARYNREYRNHSCIVRRFVWYAENNRKKSLINDFDIKDYNVEFSLNKRERWGLPDAIREYIQGENDSDDLIRTDLIIRHKLKRQASCVAYYADKGLLKKLVPKCGRYFDGKSATDFKIRHKTKIRRRQNQEEEEENEIPLNTVRYEVFLPCSQYSSLAHNPKYVKHEEDREDESAVFGGRKKKKQRKKLRSRDIDELLEFSDPRNDHFVDPDMSIEDSDIADDIPRGQFTLKDFLKPARKPKRKSQRRLSRESDVTENKKTRVVQVEDKQEVGSITVSTETSNQSDVKALSSCLKDSTVVCQVAVMFNRDEIAFDRLQTKYGTRYIEARCEPRKFSIDITDDVEEHVRCSKEFRDIVPSSLHLYCYLTFTERGLCSDDASLNVYHVGLNLASSKDCIKLENVPEMVTYTIDELQSMSMDYINRLPKEAFVKSDIYGRLNEPLMKFELFNSRKKWNVTCIHPEDLSDISKVAAPGDEAVDCEFPSDFCNICYEEITTECNVDDTRIPATCLTACGHWFCDKCWRKHLINILRSGTQQFVCPEYECGSAVDFATLLSFLHIGDIRKHISKQESEKVNSSDTAIWCPISYCGRAIFAERAGDNSGMPSNVVCQCGVDLCYKCMKNAHWPATCAQANRFRKKIIALKDFMDLPKYMFVDPLPAAVIVKGKSCPACKRFIEKISGCSVMTCACGASFCWTCVQRIFPYSAHDCVTRDQMEMVVTGNNYINFEKGLGRTRFYTLALEHRKLRLCSSFYLHRSRAFSMSKSLTFMAVKNLNIQHQISKLPEADKQPVLKTICKFMMRMLSIKLELHHVIEHVAVVMDNLPYDRLRIRLQDSVNNMEFYAQTIASILEKGAVQDLRFVVPHLQDIQRNAQRSVSNLLRLMPSVEEA